MYPFHLYTPPCHWCNTPAPNHTPTCKYRPVPTALPPGKCECGSGSNERSGAHSHWCKLWIKP